MTKSCTTCKEVKLTSEFYRHECKRDGYSSVCRKCSSRYYYRNKEKFRARDKAWQSKNKDWLKFKSIRRNYYPELTVDEAKEKWQKMFDAQEGKCSICLNYKPLCVEHDHETGVVRSLACHACNTTLGKIEENPIIARRLLNYILKWKSDA